MFMRNQKTRSHYDDLFEFIQKNTSLPGAIAGLSMDMPAVCELQRAIHDNDYTSSVFQNDEVDLYLLYLIKEQKIHDDSELNFWSGMTIYLYILALREYTEGLSVIPGDSKRAAAVEMVSFSQDGRLTQDGEVYLKYLAMSLKLSHITLSSEDARAFILSLPSTEQHVIKLSEQHQFSGLMKVVRGNLPFTHVPIHQADYSDNEVLIPSFSMMNYFLKQVSPQPLRLQPAFGRIGLETLGLMHQKGLHHVPLSSLLVKSNLIRAHEQTDVFAVCVHDILHAFMGSLLSVTERQFLFDAFVPRLKSWKQVAEQYDVKLAKHLEDFIARCNDLDLSPIRKYQDDKERFEEYIYKNFEDDLYGKYYPYKNTLFLLEMKAVFDSQVENDEKYFWLRLMITHHLRYHAKQEEKMAPLIGAILYLASHEGKDLNELEIDEMHESLMAEKGASLYFFKEDYLPFAQSMTVEKALAELQAANIPAYWINYLLDQRALMQEADATVVTSSLSLFATSSANRGMPENESAADTLSCTM